MKKLLPIGIVAALALSIAGGPAAARQNDEKNIVQTAQAAGNFKTLTKLVVKAGLADTLSNSGPYTVFAPTDAAFKKVPKSTLKSLARHPRETPRRAPLPRRGRPRAELAGGHAQVGEDPEREVRSDPHRRRQGLREQREGDQGRHQRVERRHPRREPRPDSAREVAVPGPARCTKAPVHDGGLRLGYACVNTGLPSSGRTVRLANATPDRLRELIAGNLEALETILRWNAEHGIEVFRVTSNFIPFGSHPVNRIAWWDEFGERLRRDRALGRAGCRRIPGSTRSSPP